MTSLREPKRVLLVSGSNYTPQIYDGLRELTSEYGVEFSILSDGSFEPDPSVFTNHYSASLRDTDTTIRYMESLSLRFDAVANKSSEWLTPLTALLAEIYGCRGVSPQVAFLCRSKFHMREAFSHGGLPTPRYRICKNFDEIMNAAKDFGSTCVAKPIGGNASYGTFRIEPESEAAPLKSMYDQAISFLRKKAVDEDMFAFNAHELAKLGIDGSFHMVDDYLVEEFLSGTQVSIDSLVQDGKASPLGIAHQIRMSAPFFLQTEEYMPFECPPTLLEQLVETNQQAVTALGVRDGATHTEIIITSDGPRVLEVACRIGGDNIHDSVYQTSGTHLFKELILLLMGEARIQPSGLLKEPRSWVAMKYFLPERSGVVTAISLPPTDLSNEYSFVTELGVSCAVGDRVSTPPESYDFLGYVQVKGASAKEAKCHLEEISSQVSFCLE